MLRGQLERGGGGSSATLDGAPPVGLGQCRWRKAGLQEAEQSLHGVQGDHVGSPGGAQDGEQREERAGEGCRGWPRTAPPPCPASPADPRPGPDRPWGRGRGGARNGPFLALFTWPGGATGDEPRDAGAGLTPMKHSTARGVKAPPWAQGQSWLGTHVVLQSKTLHPLLASGLTSTPSQSSAAPFQGPPSNVTSFPTPTPGIPHHQLQGVWGGAWAPNIWEKKTISKCRM